MPLAVVTEYFGIFEPGYCVTLIYQLRKCISLGNANRDIDVLHFTWQHYL